MTDWANRVTSYTYDANNRVVGVTKPDGSITTTVYDNKQRVTSTVEKTVSGTVITGFEYTYDDLSRIVEEKVLANSTKMCYTYDSLSRVTARVVKNSGDNSVISTEQFSYDAAGNVTADSSNSEFVYDTNNRLTEYNGNTVSYDLDGNMWNNGVRSFTYDSANRLIYASGYTYTYNAEDVRIRNLCNTEDTTYTYDTNCKLSKLLCKTTNGVVTKYVYGRGLIGEEVGSEFKTYHFDCRGSTIAITDAIGNISDTFAYDTYGKLISRTGTSEVIFGYNGRDGVVTDKNGLVYMRARYYSPEMKRFINADIVAGEISDSTSLNRFAYVGGNPITFIDPTGRFGILTLMLIGAGIGAAIEAIGSVVSQKIESEIENKEFELDVGELIADTVWGAVDGAISFSPLGPTGMAIADAATSVLSSLTDELIDDEEGVNITRMGKSVAVDMILGQIKVDFTGGKNVAKALEATKDSAVKLAKRKNEKWAKKQIARQAKDFNDLLKFKIYEDAFNGLIGIGTRSAFKKADYALDGYINLPDYLDDGIVIPRK